MSNLICASPGALLSYSLYNEHLYCIPPTVCMQCTQYICRFFFFFFALLFSLGNFPKPSAAEIVVCAPHTDTDKARHTRIRVYMKYREYRTICHIIQSYIYIYVYGFMFISIEYRFWQLRIRNKGIWLRTFLHEPHQFLLYFKKNQNLEARKKMCLAKFFMKKYFL